MSQPKPLNLAEAIDGFAPDGSFVALDTARETLIPFAAGHELIRPARVFGPVSDCVSI